MTCSYLCGSGIFMRVSHLVYIGHESLSHGSESLVPSSRFSRVLPRSAPALRFSRVLPRSSFGYLPSCVCTLLYIYASIFSSILVRQKHWRLLEQFKWHFPEFFFRETKKEITFLRQNEDYNSKFTKMANVILIELSGDWGQVGGF